jgi:molecular chaperone GrpE
VTEENVEIKEEPTESLVPKDRETSDAGVEPTAEASATEVLEGEIVDEDEEASAEEEIDELTALGREMEQTQAQADEYLDDLRRERAAFQNYKRRQENERAELRQMAMASLLTQILPISDDLERALSAVPEEQSDQPWVEGIDLIQRKLRTTLESNGAIPIEAEPGQPFDPFVHEAVSYEENDSHQEGEIIDVVQKGYKLGERTLRPAMVRVAR